MKILIIVGVVYLVLGAIHGFYLLFRKKSTFFELPINIIAGPPVLFYIIYTVIKKKRIRYY
ncbi:hypothetical protein A2V49_04420 [candidate division WWE3 bacterium RBG_19FT_COMBO_34_6]|uniref:Uncharacterized protein n=1 Tax=candidate division WWE3 bacterium RBG_19FT_COMBO_34_6 TaxID=1802612 RepID=A0A1F4UMS2_UNCKA|nr:MAG: hypothetical protein A2V49_04420 [candidate division WWE3 bacterium RBG_19FT_COMBO_34_6]